jgi:M6 family metalloprotease-like protein
MAEYFHDISLGKIWIDFTFFGDKWIRLNNTMEYYGQGDWNDDFHGWTFVVDSVGAWENFVNLSDYDSLMIVHAGDDQASHTNETWLLWSQNFCNLGRTSKTNVTVDGHTYSFWGIAYVSEYDEYGMFSHEFGHSLGLPDLYVENKTEAFDGLSLMADGCWNGFPQATKPAPLDCFSLYILGWVDPSVVELNSTEEIFEMKSLGSSDPSVLKVPLSDTEYYLIEVREKSGYDEYTVPSTSVVVYLIDEMKKSATGIATLLNGGRISVGSVFSDVARGVYVSFVSFNSSTHVAKVGLSSQLFFVRIDIPDSIGCISTVLGKVQVLDANNNPAQYAEVNVTIDENMPLTLVTDENGNANFQLRFGPNELGNHTVRVTSVSILAGETEKTIVAIFPWESMAVVLLSITLMAIIIFAVYRWWKKRALVIRSRINFLNVKLHNILSLIKIDNFTMRFVHFSFRTH